MINTCIITIIDIINVINICVISNFYCLELIFTIDFFISLFLRNIVFEKNF